MSLKTKFKSIFLTQVKVAGKHEKFACFDINNEYIGDVIFQNGVFVFSSRTRIARREQMCDLSDFIKKLSSIRGNTYKV